MSLALPCESGEAVSAKDQAQRDDDSRMCLEISRQRSRAIPVSKARYWARFEAARHLPRVPPLSDLICDRQYPHFRKMKSERVAIGLVSAMEGSRDNADSCDSM